MTCSARTPWSNGTTSTRSGIPTSTCDRSGGGRSRRTIRGSEGVCASPPRMRAPQMPDDSRSIVLVSMPWAMLEFPSIPLGILTGVLKRAGIQPVNRAYNLSFVDHLNRTRSAGDELLTLDEYSELAAVSPVTGLADWVFSLPPFREL